MFRQYLTIGLRLGLTILVVLILVSAGCGGPTPTPTPTPEIVAIATPVVTILRNPPGEVPIGGQVALAVEAPESDLKIRWRPERGEVSNSEGPSTIYTAPDEPGDDTVEVVVTSDGGRTTKTVDFTVVVPPTETLAPTDTPTATPTLTKTPTSAPTKTPTGTATQIKTPTSAPTSTSIAPSTKLGTPVAASSCIKPTADANQPQSTYLPLAIGNKWMYKKIVFQGVFAWEAYEEKDKGEVTFAVGKPPDIPIGESEETYLITDTVRENGLQYWEVQVSDSKARDGRYGSWYTTPDKILWGRVPSSEQLIEIDEIMITLPGFFTGEKRHVVLLLVEPLREGMEATLSRVGLKEVEYVASSTLVKVEVPAGEFPCSLQMVTKVKAAQYSWMTYSYYAPGVGLVKEVQKDDKGNITYAMELTEYELK